MKQPMWDAKAVKAYETGQGVELVNEPYPHYVPINKQGVENMTEEDEEFKRIERRIEIETQPLINFTEQKVWVGLTDEEIHNIAWPHGGETMQAIIKHIVLQAEQLLKERNT
jgi:hypothetical protein